MCGANIAGMDIREAVKAFAAMDANGRPFTILKGTMLSSVGDGCGFNGRIDEIAAVASFVYFGIVYYARKDAVEANTRPMVFTSRRQRNAASF